MVQNAKNGQKTAKNGLFCTKSPNFDIKIKVPRNLILL